MFRILKPEKAYVTEDVYNDERAARRVERMMACVEAPLERVNYEQLNELAPRLWGDGRRWGAIDNPRDPDLVFTTAKFHTEDEKRRFKERYPNLGVRGLWGYNFQVMRPDGFREWRQDKKGVICHSARELHSAEGCPFRCGYCGFNGLISIFVNIEEFVSHLDDICGWEPDQRLYKWDNRTDTNCFEPEWGATELLVRYFADKPGKYFLSYVGKSDNVDFMLPLPHKGKTILQWSIGARTQTTRMEPETAPWDRRIEAARKCQEAGYIVRFRFSPMIPVKNWREENAELIARIFERTKPDVLSLCPFGWMDLDAARACLDFDLIDPDFVRAMEASAPFIKARGFTSGSGQPMPHDARAAMHRFFIDEIRKHDNRIPVSLCLETVEMWSLFQRELGMPVDPGKTTSYYCNCGPMCTPEHPFARGITPGKPWFGAGAV